MHDIFHVFCRMSTILNDVLPIWALHCYTLPEINFIFFIFFNNMVSNTSSLFMSMLLLILINISFMEMEMERHMLICFFHIHVGR
jgi:hypothetical protein